jgi:hypothetical protein
MHQSGCLALIKLTLAAIPTYAAISHALPAWLLKAFVKIFKAFLWMGAEMVNGGKCLVTWCCVQRPYTCVAWACQTCFSWAGCSDYGGSGSGERS